MIPRKGKARTKQPHIFRDLYASLGETRGKKTDNTLKIIKACEELKYTHDTLTLHVVQKPMELLSEPFEESKREQSPHCVSAD